MRPQTILLLLIIAVFPAQVFPASHPDKTLVWGVHTRPTVINPVLTSYSVSCSIIELVFNSLVRFSPEGKIEPDLATSWEISPDGIVYTFHLRPNVFFHDGTPLSSADVKFTYERFMDKSVGSPFASSFNIVKALEAPDPLTFRIILSEPYQFFINRLAKSIVPRHLLKGQDMNSTAFNRHPVGTGPFKFKEWKGDNTIVLEANRSYYEGRPKLDRIIIRVYPDLKEVWTALMRSEIDFADFIAPEDAAILKNDRSFQTFDIPEEHFYAVYFNPEDKSMSDPVVRKAISLGIDRQKLIASLGGIGRECYGPFNEEITGVADRSAKPYDPVRARELFASAGWSDVDDDGILEKEGEELELRILADSRFELNRWIIKIIRQQLASLGVKVRLIMFPDESALTPDFLKETRPQAIIKLFYAGVDPGRQGFDWASAITTKEDRLWVYYNRDINLLFDQAVFTNLRPVCRKVQQIIEENTPACFLFYPCEFHAISSDFIGVEPFFNKNMAFYQLKDWSKRERR